MNEQAKTAILARNESLTAAFVNRTSDGIFVAVAKEYAPHQWKHDYIKYDADTAHTRQIWLGYEVLTDSLKLDI